MQVVLVATLLVGVFAAKDAAEWDFDTNIPGKIPVGWKSAKTSEGPGSVWRVVEDGSAPSGKQVLAQVSGEGPRPLFNLCVADSPELQDVDISVQIKANGGKIDQGGGVVWRYRDANNYYIARANPLESNYRVYKVVGGKRQQLDSAEVEVPTGKWFAIRVVHRENHIECYLDGTRLLEADDAEFSTPGRIGLWSKADAVTAFDDLTAHPP